MLEVLLFDLDNKLSLKPLSGRPQVAHLPQESIIKSSDFEELSNFEDEISGVFKQERILLATNKNGGSTNFT